MMRSMVPMNRESEYHSLSCSLYDQLEAFSVRRDRCTVRYRNEDEIHFVVGTLTDVFAKDGAEYLTIDNSTTVRLDRLIDVNGIPMNGPAC